MSNKQSHAQKPAPALPRSDEVTVMVFKDNDASRSFQVSLGWITRLGFGVGLLVAAALLGSFFAVKFYRIARKADPSHIIDLESQLTELKATNTGLEARLAAASAAAPTVAQTVTNPLPVPTVTVTVTPVVTQAPVNNLTPALPQTGSTEAVSAVPLFTALPRQTQDISSAASKLPITVSPARTSWSTSGLNFNVDFDIQYTSADHGSQQGRIIVLARGPNTLLAYPNGILGRAGSESLINAHQGEYFSVSRFREVKAEFPGVRSMGLIHDVEILIMSLEGQLLFYQKLPAAPAPNSAKLGPARQAAPPKVAPSKPKVDSSELIEPGVDQ